jgi:hypothetical protein
MTSSVEIKTRGKRGGDFSAIKEVGQVVAFVDRASDYISVDSYEGFGKDYKKRSEALIEISVNGVQWKGTAEELSIMLSKK